MRIKHYKCVVTYKNTLSVENKNTSIQSYTKHDPRCLTPPCTNSVTQGFRYKMRFVYAHLPINASITNNNTAIEIRIFLSEKKVRKVDLHDGVTVVRSEKVKDELVLDGNDIELVFRSCALINQKCHVKNKDIQKFLDGIYVSDKAKIEECEN